MLRRIQVQWFRFTHGEDVFDGWPGEDMERAAAFTRHSARSVELQPAS